MGKITHQSVDSDMRLYQNVKSGLDNVNDQLTEKENHLKSQYLNVKYPFGTGLTALKGDGTNEQTTFLAFINYAKTRLPMTLFFPNGVYGFTDLGNIAYSGLTLQGATDRGVVFKCLNTAVGHIALNIDAFISGQVVGFVQRFNLKNVVIEGNSETEIICNVQGIARSTWENVYTRIGKANTTSKGFAFKGVMLSSFKNLMCSTQIDTMSSVPYYGIHLDEGIRAGSTVGHASNNVFTSCYFEGVTTGIYSSKGDQNTFVGGASENCSNIGLFITATSLYNTFIGTGFENSNGTLDIDDTGLSTQYVNCYSNKYVKLRGQGEKISGGMFNDIEIMPTAVDCTVENVKVRHWGGSVGFVIDAGATRTKFRGIYDDVTLTFKYPTPARVGITVGASPFTWTNNTGNFVHLFFGSGGTISSIQSVRNGGDPFTISPVVPNMYTIPPNDGITVTYTALPSMSYRELNGY